MDTQLTDNTPTLPSVAEQACVQKVPLYLMSDLVCAFLTARNAAMLHSTEVTMITGSNLCELLCSLLDYHPEPIVGDWIKYELRNLDQGKQIW